MQNIDQSLITHIVVLIALWSQEYFQVLFWLLAHPAIFVSVKGVAIGDTITRTEACLAA